MPRNHPQSEGFQRVAATLLAALTFLFVASYLVLPCMARDASQFQNFGAPNSCSEHHLFKPQADISRLFKSIAAETPFRLPIALSTTSLPYLFAWLFRLVGHALQKRRRRARAGRLPFSTADPPRLPYFSALRDA